MTDQLGLELKSPQPWLQAAAVVHPPLARASDPETSHEAARAYADAAATQAGQLDAYYRGAGARGATHWEAARDLGWTPEQVARRLAGLRDASLLFTLKLTREGEGHRASHVWVSIRFRGEFAAADILEPKKAAA